ncbi:MAG: hypothetical protein LUC95_04170 [Lachnospiraceae bacterium]|nr:hypothetical protein [Lachnospiraceae bacterium]
MSFVRGSEIISDLVFALYLVWAAYQDCKERLVIRGTHLLGLAAVGIYLLPAARGLDAALYGDANGAGSFTALLLLISERYGSENAWGVRAAVWLLVLLCEGIYRRFSLYGLADSFVFLNCALYYWVRYSAFFSFFLFWWLKAFSGFLFLMLQLVRWRRLKWRLKEPAAYIPCILSAFALTNTVLKGYNHWY